MELKREIEMRKYLVMAAIAGVFSLERASKPPKSR